QLFSGTEEGEPEGEEPSDRLIVAKWATALASNPKYFTSKSREYLLEKLAGAEFDGLPVYEILRRAEVIFEAEYRTVAEDRLREVIHRLRDEGLNLNGVAMKLGISRDRVSGLVSASRKGK